MNDVELAQLSALMRCTFSPGSSPKSFIRRLADKPAEYELSAKEAAFLDNLAHQYRRQIGRCLSVACFGCVPPAPADPEEIRVALDAMLDDRPKARAAFVAKYQQHMPTWLRRVRALYNLRNGTKFAHLYEYATACAVASRRASTRGDVYCRLCGERLFAGVKDPHRLVAESVEAQRHLTICALQALAGMREPAKPGHRALPLEDLWRDDEPRAT